MGVLGLRLAQSLVAQWIPVGSREVAFVSVMAGGLLVGHAWTFHLVDPRGWPFVGLGKGLAAGAHRHGCAAGCGGDRVPRRAARDGLAGGRAGAAGCVLGAALASLVVLVPASLWEEMFVRGYAYSVLRERLGAVRGDRFDQPAFALMHYLNAGASLRAVIVVLMAGVFLGLVREATRSLYAAWAAHLAWNVVLVAVLHATVSGVALAAPDYRVVDAGPDWATGGDVGAGRWVLRPCRPVSGHMVRALAVDAPPGA